MNRINRISSPVVRQKKTAILSALQTLDYSQRCDAWDSPMQDESKSTPHRLPSRVAPTMSSSSAI